MVRDEAARAVPLYLLLTAVFCTPAYLAIAYSALAGGAGGYVTALMWGPAIAAITTIWLRGMDWRRLGFAWRDPGASLASYLLPIGYAGLAYAIVWLTGMGGFAGPAQIAPIASKLGWTITEPATFVPLYFVFAGVTMIVAGTARGLGEELGWRGFLAPILYERFGFTRSVALTGVIWTAWHVPLILCADYNSAAPRPFALLCFFVMVMNLSFIMAWFRLKSGSVWPAAILHGSHNLFVQAIFTPLTAPRGDITAYAIDEFGFMLPLVTFIVALWLWLRRDRAILAHERRAAAECPDRSA